MTETLLYRACFLTMVPSFDGLSIVSELMRRVSYKVQVTMKSEDRSSLSNGLFAFERIQWRIFLKNFPGPEIASKYF